MPGTVLKSKLVQSLPDSPSLRTTVPETIRVLLGLGRGDTLDWTFETETREVRVSKGIVKGAGASKAAAKHRTKSR